MASSESLYCIANCLYTGSSLPWLMNFKKTFIMEKLLYLLTDDNRIHNNAQTPKYVSNVHGSLKIKTLTINSLETSFKKYF